MLKADEEMDDEALMKAIEWKGGTDDDNPTG